MKSRIEYLTMSSIGLKAASYLVTLLQNRDFETVLCKDIATLKTT